MKIRSDIGSLIVKVCFLIAFGIAFAMDMVTEGVCMWKGFYNVGQYYEPKYESKDISWTSDVAEDNNYSVKIKTKGKYAELRLYVEGLAEGTGVNACYYESLLDESGSETYPYCQEVCLKNGENVIRLSGTEINFISFLICANGSDTIKFDVTNFKLYEIPPTGNLLNAIGWFIAGVFFMIVIYKSAKYLLEKYVYVAGSGEKFSEVYGKICEVILERESKKDRSLVRTFLWFCILVYFHYGNLAGWFSSGKYVLNVVLVSIFLVTEAFLYFKIHDDIIITVNDSYFMLCFCFSLTVTISNVVIYKTNIQMTGVFLMFVAGILGYSITTFNDIYKFLTEINVAVLIHFVALALFCFLFRTKRQNILYNGPFITNYEFAYYLLFVFIVFLVCIYEQVAHIERARHFYFLLFSNTVCVVLIGVLLFCTQENISLLIALIFLISTIFFMFQYWSCEKKREKKMVGLILFILGLSIGIVVALFYLKRISSGIQLEVRSKLILHYLELFKGEELEESHAVFQIGAKKALAYHKNIFLKQLQVWKIAFLKYNILGHSSKLAIWGSSYSILSGYVNVLYQYGCTASIFFVTFVWGSIWRSINCFISSKKNNCGKALLSSGIAISFAALELFSRIETPFANMLWLAFFILSGNLLFDLRRKQELTNE